MDSEQVRAALRSCLGEHDDFVELRYHERRSQSVAVMQGRVESSSSKHRAGTGVRVLHDGTFGFASCGTAEPADVRRAIERAREAAQASAALRKQKIEGLAPAALATGHFEVEGADDIASRPLDAKIQMVDQIEARARAASPRVQSASCAYSEVIEEKAIVTSDGADCSFRLVRPEFRVSATALDHGERQVGFRSMGATGGWQCLFARQSAEEMGDAAAKMAVDLLAAKRPAGGRAKVILSPAVVGLLAHEAIGHTVEADFVASGSVAAGKLGQRVGSELVTLCDSGASEHHTGAGGTLPVDDEGVPTGRTVIIDQGILRSYLHDRESAARYGVAPTGSARAWEYSDTPLIRMRNTYLEPGESTLEEMIATLDDGYLLEGAGGGQADATGEFMFGVQRAYRIENGKLGALVRGVTISGIAFDVMKTVDAVSRDFLWDLGSGYCGKGQPAKVDAGGPYVRCEVMLGGQQ